MPTLFHRGRCLPYRRAPVTRLRGHPPPGVPSEQLAQAQGFIDGGNKLIDDASQKYLDGGFTEEALTKVKTDLVTEVTAVVGGNGASAKYTFDECNALLTGAPAPASSSEAPPASSSSAAK